MSFLFHVSKLIMLQGIMYKIRLSLIQNSHFLQEPKSIQFKIKV